MKRLFLLLGCAWSFVASGQESFVSLFNGHDLTGWVNVNCAPETWTVRDGMIHCTGHPTGALRTTRQYENFILELEWRHLSSGGNSGVFIWGTPIAAPGVPFLRGIEVQVLDHGFNVAGKNEWYTTHGDVFPIHGATMKPFGRHNGMRSFPSEERSKGMPEWNQYRVVCSNGVIRLHVNGKEVSGGEDCNYRKGYIGLESEGGPIDFRNIRIQELPSNNASPDVSAPMNQGWRNLFTGLDLRGWATNADTATRWRAQDEHLVLRSGAASPEVTLWTEQAFGNAEFVLDCRPPKNAPKTISTTVLVGANHGSGSEITLKNLVPGKYQRFVITVRDREVTVQTGDAFERQTLPASAAPRGALGLPAGAEPMEFMNLYVRDL